MPKARIAGTILRDTLVNLASLRKTADPDFGANLNRCQSVLFATT
jgi:hypothetical protein